MGVWARIMTLVAPELVRNNSFFSVPLRPSRVRLVERKKKVHFWYGLAGVDGGSGSPPSTRMEPSREQRK